MGAALMLLDRGASLMDADNEGLTALHMACWKGHMDTALMLMERGANPTDTNNDGNRPIDLAVRYGHSDLAAMLRDKFVCARPNCLNSPSSRCSKCKCIFYCSKECQVADWRRHKKACRKKA